MRALLAVAGGVGSGKTSVAVALADALGGERRSFGDAVRAEARRRGLDDADRTTLQDLGNELIEEGWVRFVGLVVETVDSEVDVIVIDGVRHHDAIDGLRSFSVNRSVLTIFVRTSLEVRIERMAARDQATREQVEAAMAHDNESEVASLEAVCRLVVDNDEPLDVQALAAEVRARLS